MGSVVGWTDRTHVKYAGFKYVIGRTDDSWLIQKSLLTRPSAVLTASCSESLSWSRKQEASFLEIVRERGKFLFTVNTPPPPPPGALLNKQGPTLYQV